MVSDAKWQDRARGLLRAQLSLRNMGYKELVEKLAETGIKETPQSIANKISRAGFNAAWFLRCLHAIGCDHLDLKWPD